jgi:hypothetical protein
VRSPLGGSAALVVLIQVLAPAVAVAAPLTADLTTLRAPGAEDCPDQGALSTMIARILNNAPAEDGPARPGGDVRALVEFSRTSLGYQATLRLHGAKEGERTLTDTGPTCTALGRAVSITMALLLDAQEEITAAPPPPVAVLAPPPPQPPTPAATAGFLALSGGPVVGVVGPPSVAGALALDLRFGRRAQLQLAGQYVAPRSTSFDTGSVDVSLLAGRLGLCGVVNNPDAVVQVALCGQGVGGQLRGTGSGFLSGNNAATLAWFGAGGGLALSTLLGGRWLLGASVEALVPVRKYTFSVGNRGVATGSDAVSGMLQLSVGVKIW